MKLSVSMSEDEVEFIDSYAAEHGVEGRSAVVQRAVSLLRATELGDDYASAWDEWREGDAGDWEVTVDDGLAAKGGT